MRSLALLSGILIGATQILSIAAAASKFLPDVTWRPKSVLTADFSCRGRREQAILGVTSKEIVVAVFLNGTNAKPEVLRYSAAVRDAGQAKLTFESLNFDPDQDTGPLPGFKRSRTCKGLNLSDDQTDSAHIYRNHDAKRFDDWVR
jgi:hypothetical protein